MDYDALFPGRFLKSGEFAGRDVTLTIAGIRIEELPQDKGGNKSKGVIAFRETKKELVLNRTNGEAFKGMFGRDTDTWVGKRVTLYPAEYTDPFTHQRGTAIRVRGSPDISGDLEIEVRLPRKAPIRTKMVRTGQRKGNGKPARPEAREMAADDVPPPDFSQEPPF